MSDPGNDEVVSDAIHPSARSPKVKFTRHSRDEYLARNLERLAARRARKTRPTSREAAPRRMLAVVAVASVTVLVATGVSAVMFSADAATQAAALQAQITQAQNRARELRPTSSTQPQATTATPPTTPQTQRDAAQEAAKAVADAQNKLFGLTVAVQANDEGLGGDPAALLPKLNKQRLILSGLFAPSAKPWSDERVIGWAAVNATAVRQGDARLVWVGTECTWRVKAVTPESLTSAAGAAQAMGPIAVLWICTKAAAESATPRAWASATFDSTDTLLRDLTVHQAKAAKK